MPPLAVPMNSTNVRKLSGLLAVATAARLFANPPRHAHTVPELELLATGTRFKVNAGETRLAAWRFGPAEHPAVVLCHGWGGRGARFVRTEGLGHRRVLRDEGVVRDAVDFITGRVVFAPPPARGEATAYQAPAALF